MTILCQEGRYIKMKINENLKKVLVDDHVDNLVNGNLNNDEHLEETKLLRAGIGVMNDSTKLANETERLAYEKKKFEKQMKFDESKFEFDKSKFEYQKQKDEQEFEYKKSKDAEDAQWRQKEFDFKMDQFKFEVHKFNQEYELRKVESKRNFIIGLFGTGVKAILGIGYGVFAHKEFMMSRVMEYRDAGRPTETMRESEKSLKDMMKKSI